MQAAEADLKKHGIVQTGKTGVRKKNPYVDVLSTATKDLKSLANDLGMSIGSRARMELDKAKTKETPKDKFEEAMK
uniref:P27 family phage terminase small subunit n=1 Tax=Lentilactobacillus hilgardii TaxID=1588 RepID=UPI00403F75DC